MQHLQAIVIGISCTIKILYHQVNSKNEKTILDVERELGNLKRNY